MDVALALCRLFSQPLSFACFAPVVEGGKVGVRLLPWGMSQKVLRVGHSGKIKEAREKVDSERPTFGSLRGFFPFPSFRAAVVARFAY